MDTGGDNTLLARKVDALKVADISNHTTWTLFSMHAFNNHFMPLQIDRFYWGPNIGQ